MKINIETIPHSEQRYDTCGDYWTDADGTLQVRVSDTGDETYNQAVILHELWERFLIKVQETVVDDFDIDFEKNRVKGNEDEPGDDTRSPYRDEHCTATGIERIFIGLKGKSWKEYDSSINLL